MRSAEINYSKRSGEVLSGCLFEERSDELYPVGADRVFSRKPYQATSFSGVYAAESGNTFLFAMKKKSTAAVCQDYMLLRDWCDRCVSLNENTNIA
jgi:hypothetical protein